MTVMTLKLIRNRIKFNRAAKQTAGLGRKTGLHGLKIFLSSQLERGKLCPLRSLKAKPQCNKMYLILVFSSMCNDYQVVWEHFPLVMSQ